jgi:hypothetical protein
LPCSRFSRPFELRVSPRARRRRLDDEDLIVARRDTRHG